jgi:hypothetical protein
LGIRIPFSKLYGQTSQSDNALKEWVASGAIVDEDSKPIEGVVLTPSLYDSGLNSLALEAFVRTDAEGRWHWSIDDHPRVYSLRAAKPGYMPREVTLSLTPQAPMALQAASSIQGYVVDASDREVEGAQVAYVESGNSMAYRPLHHVLSDNRGWFYLDGLLEPNVNLRAWNSQGYSGQLNAYSIANSQPAVIELLAPVTLSLKILDGVDAPLSDATVQLRSWNRTGIFSWKAQSDSNGEVVWPKAPQGLLAFEVNREGYHTTWKHITIQGPHVEVIRMQPLGVAPPSIVDDETGKPVDRFVVLNPTNKTNASLVPKQELTGWHADVHLPSSSIVGEKGSLRLSNIPFFDHVDLEICALGFNRFKFRLDNQTDLTSAPEVRLKQPNTVTNELCQLLDSRGRPVPNGLVVYAAQGGITIATHADPIANQLLWPYHMYQQYSDLSGTFRRNARPEFEFVGAWTDKESFVGLTRALSPEKPIRMEAYSTVTIVLPPRQREPFSKVSIRQSVALDPKKSHAQAHFFSACNGDPRTGVWTCDRVPAGPVSIVRQVFDPAKKKFHSEELASLRVSPASKMDLWFDGDASLYGKLQVGDEKLATMAWECLATCMRREHEETQYFRTPVLVDGTFRFEQLPAGEYMITLSPLAPINSTASDSYTPARLRSNIANPISIQVGEAKNMGQIEIGLRE